MNIFKLSVATLFLLVASTAWSQVEPHTYLPHTFLWRKDHKQNIYTYLKLKEMKSGANKKIVNDYYNGEVSPGDTFVLENGVNIKIEKYFTYINGRKIPSTMLNMVIDKDGKISPNAFIRTFD